MTSISGPTTPPGDSRTHAGSRPRLLMLAYACRPDHGSEPGVGWNRALQAARDFDTWVITEDPHSGTAVRSYLEQHGPVPGLEFVYVPKSWLVRVLRHCPGLYYLALRLWHREAFRVAARLHAELGFDLVHQVNFMTFREPGYLWKLNAPFVWGPWGGVQNYPWRFLSLAGWSVAFVEVLRSIGNWMQLRASRRVRLAAKKAALLLACNSENQQAFARVYGITPRILAGNGIAKLLGPGPDRSQNDSVRLLWVGRLEGFKALPLLLRALAQLPARLPCELRIMGQGPKRAAWQRLAKRLGVADRIVWLPRLPKQDVYAEYLQSDLFVFTSMREAVPTVIIEALAAGLPIIYLDHHGLRDMVPQEGGVGVAVKSPRQVASDLSWAIAELADDAPARRRMGAAALAKAEQYLWSRQGEQLNQMLRDVLDSRSPSRGSTEPTGPHQPEDHNAWSGGPHSP